MQSPWQHCWGCPRKVTSPQCPQLLAQLELKEMLGETKASAGDRAVPPAPGEYLGNLVLGLCNPGHKHRALGPHLMLLLPFLLPQAVKLEELIFLIST